MNLLCMQIANINHWKQQKVPLQSKGIKPWLEHGIQHERMEFPFLTSYRQRSPEQELHMGNGSGNAPSFTVKYSEIV